MKQDSCIIQSGCSVFSFFNGVLMLYDLQDKVIYILNLVGTLYFYDTLNEVCCKLCLFVAEKLRIDTIVAFSCCKFSHQFDYSHDTTANVRTILDLLNRNDQKKKLLNQQHLFYCPNVVISVYCHPYSVMYHREAYIMSNS